jgi:hypothetical protein
MDDSGYDNNASVSPAPPAIIRLLFSLYSFFRSPGSSVKEDSDIENRSLDFRRLTVPDIDYTTFHYRLTDYHL